MKQILLPLLAGALAISAGAQSVDSVITENLFEPYAVAVDFDNTYYITDTANNRIIRYVPDTGEFRRLAGLEGSPGSADAQGVFARFSNPRGIVLDHARDGVVVADYNNHTLRLVRRSGAVTTLAGLAGQEGPAAPGPVQGSAARFHHPSGLAIDQAGNIYIADTKNNVIRRLDAAGMVTTLLPNNPDEFYEPAGVAVDDQGRVLVADTRNHSIKRINPDGTATVLAGSNSRVQSGFRDSLFAADSLFSNPMSVLFLGANHGFLVSDSGNHAIRRIYVNPEVTVTPGVPGYSVDTFAGTPTVFGNADGELRTARFHSPAEIVKDPVGGFLVGDQGNNAIRRIQTSPPLPPVSNPRIGYVTFVKDEFGELVSRLVATTHAVFNNNVVIAILAEQGTETYFTHGLTPPSSLEDTIPFPAG